MNVHPAELTFHDVRLNQSVTQTLTITNPLSVEVAFTLRPSDTRRYTIVPTGSFRLNPRQSVVVSVRLMVDSFANVEKGINGQMDHIMIHTQVDSQKIPVKFYLNNQIARSRSASPTGRVAAVRRVAERSEVSDTMNTLHEQVRHKDIRIKELEGILGNVRAKFPGFDEIVEGRLSVERSIFDEKAKKMVIIAETTDALVNSLRQERDEYAQQVKMYQELTQHDASAQLRSDGRSFDYFSGRAVAGQNTGLGRTHQQLAAMLEQTQKQLDAEKQAHYQSRTELNEAHNEIENLTRSRDQNASGRWQLQERKELSGLREQNLDQAEEIKTLGRELEKLRREAAEHRGLSEDLKHAQEEARRLKADLTHVQKNYLQLEASYAALQDAHEALEQLSGDLQQRLLSEQQKHSRPQPQHQSRDTRGEIRGERPTGGDRHGDGRVSWQEEHADRQDVRVDGMRFEESVGGGVATSTPMHYSLHPTGTAQQAIHEKNAALSLYEDRMSRYEEEIQHLQDRVADGQKTEVALRERLQDVESQLQGRDQEGRVLSERVERLKSEREATVHEAQDKEVQLRSALERMSKHDNASTINDAHLWWAYIWHAMKQQQDSGVPLYSGASSAAAPKPDSHFITEVGSGNGGIGYAQPGSMEYKPPHDAAAAVHEARLRDNLRAQAIEITQLRQELIGRKLTFKKEMDSIKDQNEHFQREIVRMQAQTRIHRADKDLKIEQLTAQVRTLSVRGDMHAQAAAALQQVETEKLTNHQLRADLDSYRLMLEEEQRKVLVGRKDCATLQAQIDSSLVLQSVVNVPGVSPATLIELMAGQITQLESDASKSHISAEEATQQLRALQRTVNMTQQRRQGPSDAPGSSQSQGPRSARARSLSPAGGRRASTGGSAGGLRSNDPVGLRRSLSNLNISSPRSLNNDLGDDLDGGEEFGFSPGGSTWPNTPFSVVVDGEATPKMVVDSLDRAVLAQRVASQEVAIAELHNLVDDLKTAAMQADRDRLVAADTAEETDRIEWERSKRKQDLLQTLLDESKVEVKKLQQRNVELEKSLSDIHAVRMVEGFNTRPRSNVGVVAADNQTVFYEDAPLMGNHTSDLGSFAGPEVNFEENQKELESTKILLRERTTQLKVVMETLDSLQLAGVKSGSGSKFHAEDEYLFSRRPGGDSADSSHHDDLGYGSSANYGNPGTGSRGLSAMENTWGMQALIKRVVELTTELSSQCAHASLAARKAEDLELMCRRQAKEINHFKMSARTLEDASSRATLQLNSVCSQLQEGDRNHIDAVAGLRTENEKLMTALRETEAALTASEIKVTALTQQANITDQSDFMGWLEFVTLDNQKIVTDSSSGGNISPDKRIRPDSLGSASSTPDSHDKVVFANKPIGESSVRDLVVSLVLQWKEYVGTVPQMKPLTTPAAGISKLSKAEQRFLQRVTDLVMNSNDRATKAQIEAQAAAARTKQVEHANQVALERLQICASHLNRYRKRCHAFELVLSVDRKHDGVKKGKLESMLRESLMDLQGRHSKALEALRSEKRDRMINEVKRAMETQSTRKLQAQVAELEARGTATLRARDEAVQSLEGKLKHAEEAMFKWFKVELPRLVSGLPATEDALSSLYNENVNPNYGLDPSPFSSSRGAESSSVPITTQLMSSMGMDRTYALSQALCASRASQAVYEMRISGLTEKLSVLKERNISLESVLIRWKDEIQQTHLSATVPSVEQLNTASMNPAGMDQYTARVPGAPAGAQGYAQVMGNANKVEAAIQQVYTYADSEAALNIKVHDLTNRLIELEEQNIELKGKYKQANARAGEMKALVDVVMGDEQQLKTKATQQLTKIRLNLEKEHAEELRRLRQSYETEKNALLGELESVAQAVEEAKLTTVDTTAWQRLVNGGTGDGGENDFHYATQPRPTPIRNYVATPPYEEKQAAHKHKNKKDSKKHRADTESTEEKKGESHKKKAKHHKRSSSARRQSSSSSESSGSSSSSDSEDDHRSDPSNRGGDRDHEDRGRGRSRRSRSPNQGDRRADQGTTTRRERGSASGPYVASSATEYARTLRKQAQQPASGRDVLDVRFTPSSAGGDSNTSTTSVSLSYLNQQQDLAEVQVENLERMLELERRRHAETKFEMSELQQLLDIQQAAFREHLNREPPGLPAHHSAPNAAGTHKPSRHGAAPHKTAPAEQDISLSSFNETISVASTSPPASERPEHNRHRLPHVAPLNFGAAGRGDAPSRVASNEIASHILHEVQREDPALWPSLSNLLEELLSVLQSMSDRAQGADDRLNVRTALAMAARVKVVCSSSPADRNISAAATKTKAGAKGDSFHADQLFEELNKYGSNPSARDDKSAFFKSSSGGFGSSDSRDHTVHLQSLANRVKMMESDFADDNIPERHLFLMRDLRMRVVELEKTLSEELQAQQSQWAVERSALMRRADENAALAEQVKQGQSESMATMRQRYEDALRSAEEALESNTSAAKSEVARLEQALAQQTAELREVRAAVAARPVPEKPARSPASSVPASTQPAKDVVASQPAARAPTPPAQRAPTPPVLPPPPPAPSLESHLLAVPADNLNEFLRMQRLISQTGDQLDYTRQQRQQVEAMHAREVGELKSHFSRYRRAQEEVVRSLEDQLEDSQVQLAEARAAAGTSSGSAHPNQHGLVSRAAVEDSLAGGPSMATNLSSLPEAEDVIRKLEFKYKVKTAELEAVMGTLGRMATGEGDTLATQDQSSFNDSYSIDVPDLRPPHPQHGHGHGHGHSQAPSRTSREGFGIGISQHGDDFGVLANEHFDSVARDMQTEIYEARIVAGNKEIEALHRNLQKERALNAQLKEQLQRLTQESHDNTSGASRFSALSAPKASAEPVFHAPSGSGSSSGSAVTPSATAPEQPKARLPTRRGSTGAIDRAGLDKLVTSNAIPTFAPIGAPAPGTATIAATTTATHPVSNLTASTDPIFDFSQEYVVPEVNSDNEKTRLLVRRMNEMRRTARVEISRLKEQVTVLKNDDSKDEQGRPKEGTIADLRQQLTGLREDNTRKNKLIASLKSAKTAEDNVLEQWKMEAGQLDENVKRLQRSVSSKDAMIKDLKSKVEHLETTITTAQREGVAPPSTGHPAPGLGSPAAFPMTDITNMPAQELRARLRSSEAERGRSRVRVQALKEKVSELEAELSRIQEENGKLKLMGERTEGLRATITRKDSMIHSLRTQVENLQAQIESLKTTEIQAQMETDKRIKQLQREVDFARRSQHELEDEGQKMRTRLLHQAEKDNFTSETRRATTTSSSDPPSGSGVATAYSNIADRLMTEPNRSAPPPRPTAVQQRRASTGTPSRAGSQLNVPSSLDSTKDDLEDVINALGVSPLHLGLGLNPRGSAMSSNYTHNASGRGSTMDRGNLMSPGESSVGEEVSSVEKRVKGLVSAALQSPVRQRRL